MAFDVERGVWSLVQYGNGTYVPRGSFIYDTLHFSDLSVSPTTGAELLYTDTAYTGLGVPFRKANSQNTSDSLGSLWGQWAIQWKYETPHLGVPSRLHQVQEIDALVNLRTRTILRYTIYDEKGDSLCGDTLWFDTTGLFNVRIFPAENSCYRPSVAFFSDTTFVMAVVPYHNAEFLEVRIYIQDMGVRDGW
jgi:hypothetical protein